jgi:MFS family permease
VEEHSNIKILKWFNFFVDFKLYSPIAIIYFTRVTGSFALGMGIFSVTMIASAFFEIPTGIYSDKIGRRKTVIWGAGSSVLAVIFYALGHSFWILAVGGLLEGLSRAFYSGNNEALLYDSLAETKKENLYDEFLGKTSAFFQIALSLSAVIGGFLATFSFSLILWISVFAQAASFLLAFQLIEPKVHIKKAGNMQAHLKEAFFGFIHNRKLRLLSLSSILGYGFGEASYQFTPAFYNSLWPIWAVGLARTLSNIAGGASFHFAGRLIRKFGGLKLMIVDNITNRVVGIFSTLFPTILSPFLMSATSIFYGTTTVAKGALMQKEFRQEQRATMDSLDSLAGSIFFGIVSLLIGIAADKLSPGRAIFLLQIFQISNTFIYLKLFHHDTKSVSENLVEQTETATAINPKIIE